jgi:hypothetical protein
MLGLAGGYAAQRVLDRMPFAVRRLAPGAAALPACALIAVNARTRVESVRGVPNSPVSHAVSDIVDWVAGNTTPDERIMVQWGGAIYLQTGRRTSIPDPEQPSLGNTERESPRLYAARLLADSVDDLIIWDHAPGRSAVSLRQLAAQCPGALAETVARPSARAVSRDLHISRVRRDAAGLQRTASDSAGAASR